MNYKGSRVVVVLLNLNQGFQQCLELQPYFTNLKLTWKCFDFIHVDTVITRVVLTWFLLENLIFIVFDTRKDKLYLNTAQRLHGDIP